MDEPAAWPAACDLSKAVELFATRGRKVHYSRLSRFVKERDFPSQKDGRSRLIDPEALFKLFVGDFTRQNMAGELGLAPTMPAAAPQPAPVAPVQAVAAPVEQPVRADPKFRMAEMQAERMTAENHKLKGNLLPKDETAGMALAAMGSLRAALNEAMNDAAEGLVTALGLPAHRHAVIVSAFKAYSAAAQEKFWREFTPLADDLPAGTPPNAYVEAVVEYAAHLRQSGLADAAQSDEPLAPQA